MNKHARVALMIIAPIALIVSGYLVWKQLRGESSIARRIVFVDVTTGEQFVRDNDNDLKFIPDFHPETGERTLYPVVREDGRYVIDEHFREFLVQKLESLGGPQAIVVDMDTFEIVDR